MTRPGRVVAVLGYSVGRPEGLHPICAARVAHAAEIVADGDVVILSGWARRPSSPSEAELMRRAWPAEPVPEVFDHRARTTAENAAAVARLAAEVGAREVVVVTSSWHAPRARLLFRAALRDSGIRSAVDPAPGGRPLRPLLGELWRWPFLPIQLVLARRR
jgi:uncharacterized SAM-binding protein YcdF (DUF218 family)